MSQSKELTAFYKSYLEWIERGAINDEPYVRYLALCGNLQIFSILNNGNFINLHHEMMKQFKEAGLNIFFPFGEENYFQHQNNKSQHLDPKRIQWVKDHIPK